MAFRKVNPCMYVNDSPQLNMVGHNPRLDFKDINMENKFIFVKME